MWASLLAPVLAPLAGEVIGSMFGKKQAQAGVAGAQGISAEARDAAIREAEGGRDLSLEQMAAYRGTGERALGAQEEMAMGDRYRPLDLPEYQGQGYDQQGLDVQIPTELAALYEIEREDADKYASRLGATRGNLFSGAAMELAANQRRRIGARQSAEGYRAGLDRAVLERGERRYGYEADLGESRFGYGAERADVMAQENQSRYYDESRYGRLADLSRMGYGAASRAASDEMVTGGRLADFYTGSGTSRAASEMEGMQANLDIMGNLTEAFTSNIPKLFAKKPAPKPAYTPGPGLWEPSAGMGY